MSESITHYQKKCWEIYKQKAGIPVDYTYLYGNPVKVHVPVDTACLGLMIIGAYPTAHFNQIEKVVNGNRILERDVPVGDHLYPFSNEVYFDGARLRRVDSGRELEELFLKELEVDRSETWITDLVKVFLFKEGHQRKYRAFGFTGELVERKLFKLLADKSRSFIEEEISICKPKVILGLGAEVNAVMLGLSDVKSTQTIEAAEVQKITVSGHSYDYFACPHPGILMREDDEGKWKNVLKKILKQVKPML